ncbi:uncharacterized protein YdhG (YjbR/CyaY superfamily) [Caulobacter ginsengisoli]|uniref:Uncharacterized protein YdhG (YjbR/CyaY superfamily) n=1 Tax=Caulobacter ginsengisoli TaxID=400775 RepID=A0ABU0IRA6_9CAUL|nr:DUF1801 domain-containing protein [Caulobacter ginsengisoli]MDQ0463891.1 uncharacterized protein YdhG (YjbR/CyaY superfamily) [Caulobacter ginsengisoli]
MVQSTAATVDEYMETVAPERLEAMKRMRALFKEVLVGYEEGMNYGMPTYGPSGAYVTAFNSQKGYIAFYAGQTAMAKFKDQLAGIDCGKGCIRYKKIEKIDFDVVRGLLEDIAARNPGVGCS